MDTRTEIECVGAIAIATALHHRLQLYRRIVVEDVGGKIGVVRQESRKWPTAARRERSSTTKLARRRFIAAYPDGERVLRPDAMLGSRPWTGVAFIGCLPDATPTVISLVVASATWFSQLRDQQRDMLMTLDPLNVKDFPELAEMACAADCTEDDLSAGFGRAEFQQGIMKVFIVARSADTTAETVAAIRRLFLDAPTAERPEPESHEESGLEEPEDDGITAADVSAWIKNWGVANNK